MKAKTETALRRAAALALAGLSLVAAGCRKTPTPRNFILITLDTQRADHISAYDTAYARTPQVDSLARLGTIFKNCYTQIPITFPAHASLFFSESPHDLKSYNNGQVLLPRKSRPPLALLFKKHGFQTAAFLSLGTMEAQFGLNDGFDTYDDRFRTDRWYLTAEEINAKVLPWLDQNSQKPFFLWVHYSDPHDPYALPDSPPDTKVYFNGRLLKDDICLNLYASHTVEVILEKGANEFVFEVDNPYWGDQDNFKARLDKIKFTASPELTAGDIVFAKGWLHRPSDDVYFFRKRARLQVINRGERRPLRFLFRGKLVIPVEEMKIRYAQEVEYLDSQIGRLFEKLRSLRLFENTAILAVGDHGEGLGEYMSSTNDRHVGHIHFLYNAYLKVPLIIYTPRPQPEPVVRTEPVSLLDVAPTIAGIMGFRRPDFYQGRDLLRLPAGESRPIQLETFRPEAVRDRFGILAPPWHLILTPADNRYELFNMELDPAEAQDVFGPASLPQAAAALKKALDEFARDVLNRKQKEAIPPVTNRTEEMLKSLGYVKN